MLRKTRAFTLIELLIVIAIIAILALIAVPNFMEAMTRAKVSRVYAEQSTLGTAIDMYTSDHGRPPIGFLEFPDQHERTSVLSSFALLTTPLAYITSIPTDPFHKDTDLNKLEDTLIDDKGYWYDTMHPDTWDGVWRNQEYWMKKAWDLNYHWVLTSFGPYEDTDKYLLHFIILAGYQWPDPDFGIIDCAYDPSNGTSSAGYIMRTNKGNFTVSEIHRR